jgi:hypothetical protein
MALNYRQIGVCVNVRVDLKTMKQIGLTIPPDLWHGRQELFDRQSA